MTAQEDNLGRGVAGVLVRAGYEPADAAQTGLAAVKSANVALKVAGPALQTFSWGGDTTLPPEAWQLSVWVQGGASSSSTWDLTNHEVDFVSPSGAIACTMRGSGRPPGVICQLSERMDYSTLPSDEEVCPDPASYGLTGVAVRNDGVLWWCSGEAPANPHMQQLWVGEYPVETYEGYFGELADAVAVPYGTTVIHADFRCEVEETGVSCWRQGTTDGFTVSSRGVETLDGSAPQRNQR